MSDRPTPDWDPRNAAVLRDQRDAYDALRERCPVAHSDFLGWTLSRHRDIVGVLADPATYSSASHHRAVPNSMDPPEHTRYRRPLERYFAPERMRAFEPRCRQIAADLLPGLLARDSVDFVAAFAQPFCFSALCAFLGWPPAMAERLRGWTHGNQEVAFSQDRAAGAALARAFTALVTEAIRARREAGAGASADLTTELMGTTVEGASLSDEAIADILRNWVAGHGTVAAALGILVAYLAAHPDAQGRLRREPALVPAAIEEIPRADGPLVANRRTATRAVTIEGRRIEAGEKLTLNWIAANRDGRAFDDPGAVRFDRDQGANLLYGAGIHVCLGAPLARLELRIALEELLARTTAIALDAAAPPQRETYPSNGFQALPVRIR